MDKILLTAFLTALAGFITAALSIVKLVNEKESKTTEYRQAWTDSLRAALSELIGKINALAAVATIGAGNRNHFIRLISDGKFEDPDEEESRKDAIKIHQDYWKDATSDQKILQQEIYQAYAKVRLHFKPDDISFSRVEQKFDQCMDLISRLRDTEKNGKRLKLREQVHACANEITAFSRNILKQEWETVKLGEPAYKKTKSWSIWICIIMFFILFTIGVHAVVSYVEVSPRATHAAVEPAKS